MKKVKLVYNLVVSLDENDCAKVSSDHIFIKDVDLISKRGVIFSSDLTTTLWHEILPSDCIDNRYELSSVIKTEFSSELSVYINQTNS